MTDVSLIIPVFNRQKYINRCVRSALSQIVDFEYEVIIVDDGSTPNIKEVLSKSLIEKIKIIRHKKNLGLPAALNSGIRNSSGMYISRLDSDDYISQHYLNVLKLGLENSSKKYFVKCDYTIVKSNSSEVVSSIEYPIGCGVMFRSEQLYDIGLYNENMKMAEDEDLEKRLKLKGYEPLHVPIPLYRYVKHNNNMSNNTKLYDFYKEKIQNGS